MCIAWFIAGRIQKHVIDDGVALGMRRLAIIDLLTGERPPLTRTNSVAVISTVRFTTIARCALTSKRAGTSFGAPLPEVLPHLYEE